MTPDDDTARKTSAVLPDPALVEAYRRGLAETEPGDDVGADRLTGAVRTAGRLPRWASPAGSGRLPRRCAR